MFKMCYNLKAKNNNPCWIVLNNMIKFMRMNYLIMRYSILKTIIKSQIKSNKMIQRFKIRNLEKEILLETFKNKYQV